MAIEGGYIVTTWVWIGDAVIIGYLAMSLLGAWVMLREGRAVKNPEAAHRRPHAI